MLRYAAEQGITSGTIFITRTGRPISRTNIWREMKSLCVQAGISQKDFANRLNISNNHLSNIERGKSAPSLLLFLDICSELKTTTDYIASGTIYADIDDEIIQKIKKCSIEHKSIISKIIDAFIQN